MKLLLFTDTHYTNRGPERRKDNYFETQVLKTNQVFDIFEREECDWLIHAGDFFNSPDVSNYVISTLISLFKRREVEILCCFGQHDISGHSVFTLKRSPLKVLEAAGVVKLLSGTPFRRIGGGEKAITLYGASFGEPVPKVYESDAYNILVTHRMIGNRSLYPGQELVGPRNFLRDNPSFSLVVCGDYHYRFVDTHQGRVIVNPGALMRKTISKFDLEHKPGVVVLNTETSKLEIFELDVKPVKTVFDLGKEDKKDNERLMRFIEGLKENESNVDWKKILIKVLEERKANQKVRELIDNALAKVKGETNG